MRMRLTALALAGVCGMALAAGQARADVIYNFVQTGATGGNDPMAPGHAFTGLPNGLELTFTDAIVATGSISGMQSCLTTLGCAGLPDLLAYTDKGMGQITLDLAFNADGTLSGNGEINSGPADGTQDSIILTGSGMNWTAVLAGTDFPDYKYRCETLNPKSPLYCIETGYFASEFPIGNAVPEPASVAVLGAGLIGLIRRRRAA